MKKDPKDYKGYKGHLGFWALVAMLLEPKARKIQEKKAKNKKQ